MGFSLNDGSFTANGVTLRMLMHMAYRVQDTQLTGGPDWLTSQKFDIDAKMDKAFVEEMRKQSVDHFKNFDDQRMLKTLLVDRFKLAVHSETRSLPVYDLVSAGGAPKLQESKDERFIRMDRGALTSSGIPMSILADDLSRRLGVTVVDKTGLKGNYAFNLRWTPDASEDARFKDQGGPQEAAPAPEGSGPTIFNALQEQLGLKLEPRTASVPFLIVDHAEMPSEN